MSAALVAAIDALLPQTQCERCGYKGCAPYAVAIAEGAAPINRCPPGGDATIAALATLLGRDATALDPTLPAFEPTLVVAVDEARCIGCALCLPACPVDAIVGAAGFMHTVIRDRCTGCELCIPVCPVDCIERENDPTRAEQATFDPARAAQLRAQYHAHIERAAQAERAAESRRQARLARRTAKRSWDEA